MSSQGLERIELGASYRLNGKFKLPVYLDVGAVVKVAAENKRMATTKDTGTAGSGGHELILFSRASRNRYYLDTTITYHLGATQVNATTGLEQVKTGPRTDFLLAAGKQFVPIKRTRINAAAVLERVGEENTEIGSGEITTNSHINCGINLLGNYAFLNNLSASLVAEYLLATDYDINSYRSERVENETITRLSLGVNYIF